MIKSSGAGDVALGDGVQRGGGDVHAGAAACFHWCRLRSPARAVVGQLSVTPVGQEQGERDSMGTGRDGLVVCGQ